MCLRENIFRETLGDKTTVGLLRDFKHEFVHANQSTVCSALSKLNEICILALPWWDTNEHELMAAKERTERKETGTTKTFVPFASFRGQSKPA